MLSHQGRSKAEDGDAGLFGTTTMRGDGTKSGMKGDSEGTADKSPSCDAEAQRLRFQGFSDNVDDFFSFFLTTKDRRIPYLSKT